MAISEDLPGVEVEVTVGGKGLREHEDRDLEEEPRSTIRYIEAISGLTFAISTKLLPHFEFKGDCIMFSISVDGVWTASPVILRTHGKKDRSPVTEGKWIASDRIAKYRFATLETVSDGHMKPGEATSFKDLGSIVVKCTHGRVHGNTTFAGESANGKVGIVSEKALKGRTLSHQVDFTEAAPKTTQWTRTSPCPREPNPVASFVFCYRSIDALKSMLIIPRTPTPPLLEDRDITTLSQDELKELQKRAQEFREYKANLAKVKREKSDDNPRRRKKARPNAGDTQLELDDTDSFRRASTDTLPTTEREVIELD
ncbi:hypothetical protein LTR37_002248 [Vermiconidia calcicola]|uniref:Uncharacterized protein n=1 Tax=Vermiconidia calcicola TaxID=1690605 RepID=A0ACC3NT53_9PEZI|nr:hypothetical protein LTR37_002248 [Vermiconidia calcicola]